MKLQQLGMIMLGVMSMCSAVLAADGVTLYTADYTVEYKGRDRGDAQFSVFYDEAREVYVFRSRTEVKGLVLRLVAPNPILERSEFEVVDDEIKPLEFRYEDGSRSGDDNYTVSFDWSTGLATLDGENGRIEVGLEGTVLDRGSMQVALMRDAAAGRVPGPYVLADEDDLKTYEYTDVGTADIETRLGAFTARRYRQQRQGSSRYTILWLVPELRHLPVRIEQFRGGELNTAFVLNAVEWH